MNGWIIECYCGNDILRPSRVMGGLNYRGIAIRVSSGNGAGALVAPAEDALEDTVPGARTKIEYRIFRGEGNFPVINPEITFSLVANMLFILGGCKCQI